MRKFLILFLFFNMIYYFIKCLFYLDFNPLNWGIFDYWYNRVLNLGLELFYFVYAYKLAFTKK